jgi:hypothetical protein
VQNLKLLKQEPRLIFYVNKHTATLRVFKFLTIMDLVDKIYVWCPGNPFGAGEIRQSAGCIRMIISTRRLTPMSCWATN